VPECGSPVQFDGLVTDIAYLVRVHATDAVGNVGPPAEAEIETWSKVD
jgi:hypothetical protein